MPSLPTLLFALSTGQRQLSIRLSLSRCTGLPAGQSSLCTQVDANASPWIPCAHCTTQTTRTLARLPGQAQSSCSSYLPLHSVGASVRRSHSLAGPRCHSMPGFSTSGRGGCSGGGPGFRSSHTHFAAPGQGTVLRGSVPVRLPPADWAMEALSHLLLHSSDLLPASLAILALYCASLFVSGIKEYSGSGPGPDTDTCKMLAPGWGCSAMLVNASEAAACWSGPGCRRPFCHSLKERL